MSADSKKIQFCHNDFKGPGVAVVSNLGLPRGAYNFGNLRSKDVVAVEKGHYSSKASILAITIRDKMGEVKSIALMDPSSCGCVDGDINSFAMYKKSAKDLRPQRRKFDDTMFYRHLAEALDAAQSGDTIKVYYAYRNLEAYRNDIHFFKSSMNPEKTIIEILETYYKECNCEFSVISPEKGDFTLQGNFALTSEGNFVALELLPESHKLAKEWRLGEKLSIKPCKRYSHTSNGSGLCSKPLPCTDEIGRKGFALVW